jgi:hypothetical protein
MKLFARSPLAASVTLAALALASTSVVADTTSFLLDTGNPAISGFAGPYASVLVNRTDSTHATITFSSLTNGGNVYLLGDGGSVAVNVNASSWTLSGIVGSNAGTGFTPGPWSDGGSGNENGFGSFNQKINSFDGFTSSSDTLSFTLTDTSGTWSSASNVLAANSQGALAGAHIFVTSFPANAANGAIVTGFAAGSGGSSPPTEIPEPNSSSLALLALGLLGAGFWTRRKA